MPGRPRGPRGAETIDSLTGFGVFGKGAVADFPLDKSGYVDNMLGYWSRFIGNGNSIQKVCYYDKNLLFIHVHNVIAICNLYDTP